MKITNNQKRMDKATDNLIMERLQAAAVKRGIKLTYTHMLFYVKLLQYGIDYGDPCPEGIMVTMSVDDLSVSLSVSKRMVIQSLRGLTDCGAILRYKGEKAFPRNANTTLLKKKFYERSN